MQSFKLWNLLFRDLSIRKKIISSFIWLTVFSLACYIVVLWTNAKKQENTSFKIDVAGRNRVLSQKVAALSFLAADEKEEISKNVKEELKKDITLLESSLTILRNGGKPEGFDYTLDPTKDPNIISKINEAVSYLEEYKKNVFLLINEPAFIEKKNEVGVTLAVTGETLPLQKVINPKVKEALDAQKALFLKGNLLKANVELTEMYVNYSKESIEHSKEIRKNILILLLIINVLVIVFNFILMQMFIANPINKISNAAEQIAQGNLSTQISYNIKDEFGTVVHAINTLASNLRKAADFIVQVGQGNFDAKYDVVVAEGIDEKDNLSSALLNMRDRLKNVAEEDKRRNWATEGLAKFGEILRLNNDNLEELSHNIISNLIKYLKANQGGLFIINDHNCNDVHLELISCYAFERKKFINKRINMGEGLVGQAWQEGEYVYITDVPNDYINITSGLGGANPRSILIMPLKINETIFGIIEIASFNAFEKYEIEFVQKLSESIASTVSTAKINERTKKLLHESQQQSEELKAQEEEMRQNMEEMAATQEEMQRKEVELQRLLEQAKEQEEEMRQNMEEMTTTQEELHSKESEAQRLLEQSKTQEKEMRQNMEKLNTIQKEMSHKSAEMQIYVNGLNKTCAVLEYDSNGKILNANDSFCKLLNCNNEEIKGKHHSIFFDNKDITHSENYKKFWEKLKRGEEWEGVVKRIDPNGKAVFIKGLSMPILDEQKNLIKVMELGIDITENKEKK